MVAGGFVFVHRRAGGAGKAGAYPALSAFSRGFIRTPPFVVCRSIDVPPPFNRPSRRRRDCSVTASVRSGETLMPPLVQDAVTSAFAESGSMITTPPFV